MTSNHLGLVSGDLSRISTTSPHLPNYCEYALSTTTVTSLELNSTLRHHGIRARRVMWPNTSRCHPPCHLARSLGVTLCALPHFHCQTAATHMSASMQGPRDLPHRLLRKVDLPVTRTNSQGLTIPSTNHYYHVGAGRRYLDELTLQVVGSNGDR